LRHVCVDADAEVGAIGILARHFVEEVREPEEVVLVAYLGTIQWKSTRRWLWYGDNSWGALSEESGEVSRDFVRSSSWCWRSVRTPEKGVTPIPALLVVSGEQGKR
jgi:hypothetical protein